MTSSDLPIDARLSAHHRNLQILAIGEREGWFARRGVSSPGQRTGVYHVDLPGGRWMLQMRPQEVERIVFGMGVGFGQPNLVVYRHNLLVPVRDDGVGEGDADAG